MPLSWLKGTGATGVAAGLPSYYNDVKSGVYGGVLTFLSAAAPIKLFEVAPNYIQTGMGATFPGALSMNLTFLHIGMITGPALAGILNGEVVAGDVIVIRYEGPKGGPGMREMLSPTSAVMGKGLGKDVALALDVAATEFLKKWLGELEYINTAMRAIKKIQND